MGRKRSGDRDLHPYPPESQSGMLLLTPSPEGKVESPAGFAPATRRFEAARSAAELRGREKGIRRPELPRPPRVTRAAHRCLCFGGIKGRRAEDLHPTGWARVQFSRLPRRARPVHSPCWELVEPVGVAPTSCRLRGGCSTLSYSSVRKWWTRQELHPRPPACKAGALLVELQARNIFRIGKMSGGKT